MTLVYKIILILFSLASLQGLNIVVNPEGLASIYNLELLDVDTNIWLRADLGGFVFAGGVLVLVGALKTNGLLLRAVAFSIGCILAARIFGVLTQSYTPVQGAAMLLEAFMAVVLLLAARNFDRVNTYRVNPG